VPFTVTVPPDQAVITPEAVLPVIVMAPPFHIIWPPP